MGLPPPSPRGTENFHSFVTFFWDGLPYACIVFVDDDDDEGLKDETGVVDERTL